MRKLTHSEVLKREPYYTVCFFCGKKVSAWDKEAVLEKAKGWVYNEVMRIVVCQSCRINLQTKKGYVQVDGEGK